MIAAVVPLLTNLFYLQPSYSYYFSVPIFILLYKKNNKFQKKCTVRQLIQAFTAIFCSTIAWLHLYFAVAANNTIDWIAIVISEFLFVAKQLFVKLLNLLLGQKGTK